MVLKRRLVSALLLLPTGIFAAQATSPAQTTAAPAQPAADDLPDSPGAQLPPDIQPTGPSIVMETSMGPIACRLFDKQAPQTVANFVALAQGTRDWTDPATHEKMHGKPLYNGTIFHRVIPGFMIQGGDPLGSGLGDPGYYVPDEVDPSLAFDVPGRMAMANSGPSTDGSQFFVTEAAQPDLNGHYTIFGQCDAPSVTVVKTISRVERDDRDKPLTPVVLKQITVLPAGAAAAQPTH